MLDHVVYGNVDEVSGVVSVCSKIFDEPQLWDDLSESPLGNLLITTWIDHIIHSCDWETEYDCVQNVNTMRFLWESIVETIPEEQNDGVRQVQSESRRQEQNDSVRQVSVGLQFLQPFVNENDTKSSQLLVRVWREFGVYRKQVLVYLLFYTTYRSYRVDEIDYIWILQDEFEFQVCMQEILNGYFWWDEKFAMRCWLDWSLYDCHKDISLTKFMEFSKDIERLREGKRYMVRSPILIRAVGGIK